MSIPTPSHHLHSVTFTRAFSSYPLQRPLAPEAHIRDTGPMEFILRLFATMAGIWVSTRLVPSISFVEGASTGQTLLFLAVIALVFTAVNSLVKPLFKVLAFPLYILTFGLFALVTNALMFMFTGWLSTHLGFPFTTGGFFSCLAGAIITAIVSSIVAGLVGAKKED